MTQSAINDGYYSGISSETVLPDGRRVIMHYPVLGDKSIEIIDSEPVQTDTETANGQAQRKDLGE